MDERTKELVAIGALVSGHCQPCLAFHLSKTRELGAEEKDVREAIEVAYMVEKGASVAMKKYAGQVLNQAQEVISCSSGSSTCCV